MCRNLLLSPCVFGWAEPYPYKQVGKKVRQDLYALLVQFASLVEFATLLSDYAIGWRLSRDYGHPQTGSVERLCDWLAFVT